MPKDQHTIKMPNVTTHGSTLRMYKKYDEIEPRILPELTDIYT